MDLGLENARVVVTGSSRGLGFAVAQAFLDEGADVLLHGADPVRVAGAAQSLSRDGRAPAFAVAELGTEHGVRTLFEAVDARWGGLDVLVNNAAIHPKSRFATLEAADWDRLMDVNLRSAFLCSREAHRRMAAGGRGGVILNAASFAGLVPAYPYNLYSVGKAALLSLTRTLAAEFAPAGVRVNAYVPGLIDTAMNAETLATRAELALSQIALRRAGRPEEVAGPVVFLASARASYVTGAALEISGGKFAVQNPQGVWDDAHDA